MANLADHGTAGSVALWQMTGHTQHILSPVGQRMDNAALVRFTYPVPARDRAVRFVLFGDVSGFSQLSESQIIVFATKVMGTLADACRPMAGDILARNTWGDGVFLVFSRCCRGSVGRDRPAGGDGGLGFRSARIHRTSSYQAGAPLRTDEPHR